MTSLYDPNRSDRNPYPHLPVIMLFPTVKEAEAHQRHLHPSEFLCLGVFGPQMGYRARAIFAHLDHWLATTATRADSRAVQEVLDHWRCRLAPGCSNQFFVF